jgi:hypothetical protein
VNLSRAHLRTDGCRESYRLRAFRTFSSEFSLMKKHFEMVLVPQPFLGGQNSRTREVIFRLPDRDGWGGSGLFGPFAGNARHSSFA